MDERQRDDRIFTEKELEREERRQRMMESMGFSSVKASSDAVVKQVSFYRFIAITVFCSVVAFGLMMTGLHLMEASDVNQTLITGGERLCIVGVFIVIVCVIVLVLVKTGDLKMRIAGIVLGIVLGSPVSFGLAALVEYTNSLHVDESEPLSRMRVQVVSIRQWKAGGKQKCRMELKSEDGVRYVYKRSGEIPPSWSRFKQHDICVLLTRKGLYGFPVVVDVETSYHNRKAKTYW